MSSVVSIFVTMGVRNIILLKGNMDAVSMDKMHKVHEMNVASEKRSPSSIFSTPSMRILSASCCFGEYCEQKISKYISQQNTTDLIYVRFGSRHTANNSLDNPWNLCHYIDSVESFTQFPAQFGFDQFIILGLSIP